MKDRPWHFASTKGGWLGTNIFWHKVLYKANRIGPETRRKIQYKMKLKKFSDLSVLSSQKCESFCANSFMSRPKVWFASKVSYEHPMRAEGSWWKFGVAKNGFTNLKFGLSSWKEPGKHQRLGGPKRSQVFGPPFFNTQNGGDFQLETKTVGFSPEF